MDVNVFGKWLSAGQLLLQCPEALASLCHVLLGPCGVPLHREEWGLWGPRGKIGHSEVMIITGVLPRDLQNISLAIFLFEIQNNLRKWVVRPPHPHPRHLFLACCGEGWPGRSHSHSLLGPALQLKQPEINEECTASTYCVPGSVLGA